MLDGIDISDFRSVRQSNAQEYSAFQVRIGLVMMLPNDAIVSFRTGLALVSDSEVHH
jgi:hypothetical protein